MSHKLRKDSFKTDDNKNLNKRRNINNVVIENYFHFEKKKKPWNEVK